MGVFICHEYFRNICPYDPYIKFENSNPVKRILKTQKKFLIFLKYSKNLKITKFHLIMINM